MENDQQVAVLMRLNLNGTEENSLTVSWQKESNLTTCTPNQDVSLSVRDENDNQEHNIIQFENEEGSMRQDLDFIKKHATGADADFILSLLHSQIDNPNRLEIVMCDLLNIPNAVHLIQEFRRQSTEPSATRTDADNSIPSSETANETPSSSGSGTDTYLQRVRDMFPDADSLFLISECQQLESWEDFSRFVNTVMISGVYPKKGAVEFHSEAKRSKVVDISNSGDYRTIESVSSDEEISSSGLVDTPRKRRRCRRENGVLWEQKYLAPPDVDVIDLSSDTMEPYDPIDPETLQEVFNLRSTNNEPMEVEVLPAEPKAWETNLRDDIHHLLESRFGASNGAYEVPGTPEPGLPFGDSTEKKSLAEIIEGKRTVRGESVASPTEVGAQPSTSKQTAGGGSLLREALRSEVSSPEVSTSCQETEGGGEEGEESGKVSEEWLSEQTANLVRIFPSTDPSFLRGKVAELNGSSEAINEFVIAKLERNDMPTRAEYEKKLEMENLQSQYTKNFSIENFLKAVPEPWTYFSQGNRNCAKYKSHSLCYLKSTFRKHYVRDIIDTFQKNNCNLYLTYTSLKKEKTKRRGSRRSEFECNQNRPVTIDIQFLQEVAFIENEEKIKDFLEGEKIARRIKFNEAKRTGSLLECQCCFDSEIMVEDIFYCPKDHAFCKNCIVRSVEVEMGYGRFKFECLASCEEKFTLACLQNVLKPELFSKVIQAIQMEEIRAAGIEDLVQCPFCNYATIMPPEEKVMICLNPECLKESCRLCKELSHIPLRCDEVEKSEEVKMRTYIENKMTEALVRTCHKCGKSFVKEDGCNKMTCTCGATMCYVCRKPVTAYSHFNGQGGTQYHKCPLYSNNDELHVDLVKRVGERAKAEIMQANPQTKLLHDPTAIVPERSSQAPLPGLNVGAALDVAMRAVMGVFHQNDDEPEAYHRQRDRREIRREANPYYHRHHRHRQAALPEESETEEDEDEDDEDEGDEEEEEENQQDQNHYHLHRQRHHHRHRQRRLENYHHQQHLNHDYERNFTPPI